MLKAVTYGFWLAWWSVVTFVSICLLWEPGVEFATAHMDDRLFDRWWAGHRDLGEVFKHPHDVWKY